MFKIINKDVLKEKDIKIGKLEEEVKKITRGIENQRERIDELLEENVEYRREIIELRGKYRILESIILSKDKGITITYKYNMIKKELGLE